MPRPTPDTRTDAPDTSVSGRPPRLLDALIGLPWSVDLQAEIVHLAEDHEIHAILMWLSGLDVLLDTYGSRVTHLCLRHVARRIAGRLDDRDRLTRHFASGILVFTIRPSEEIPGLSASISREVSGAAIMARGALTPQAHISLGSTRPMSDPSAPSLSFDDLILSLEGVAMRSRSPAVLPADERLARDDRSKRRIVLENVNVEIVEGTTSVSCGLTMGEDHVAAISMGRNGETTRLSLVADAAAQAVTKLLPGGHRVSVRNVQSTGDAADEGVWVAVDYMTPAERGMLQGVAPVRSDRYSAVARAVLSAVNRVVARAR